ncbi:alpha/beta fold hydrolase [Caulobacter sp. UNC279MFTsu5.1]|uniref:alpha/beta fold hydrolase n=1 Tax=Caulobacter sp. UNC279MFTsu5.1 TaxID=1502775 RepID=UPI000368EBA9|nr:alpha/beta hydrolase [Caulobacter sp. UNC279MFTsu5.1]SFK06344.1 Pimeloyl-ACP methyl ester carboxylesterase [Caulobacter sp. UNC279MFTsu5.1]
MIRRRPPFRLMVMLLAILAAIGVFGPVHAAPIAVPSAAAPRFTVEVSGQGPDVILVPGLASSSAVWDDTVKQLQGRYRLHVVQVAGFAGAPAGANAEGPVIQPTVDALDGYIKSAGLKSPAVIGHSMGGLMGLMLARQHPEDVGRLMVVDSLPFYAMVFSPAATVETVRPQAAAMRDRTLAATPEAWTAMETAMMTRLVKSPVGLKSATDAALASDRSVVGRALYDDLTTDLRGELAAIKTPTTLLYPWDPATAPQAVFDQLYTGAYAPMTQAKVKRIDGSYHFIMLDQPAAFAFEVEAFLR